MLKDFLRTSHLAPCDIQLLLELAAEYKQKPDRSGHLLHNETVVLYFNKPSTRTRISFETAISRLGGTPIAVRPEDLQLGRGETIEDTARVMSRYAKAVTIRTYADADVERFARAATVPVINALTDLHHPCQSIADLQTLLQTGKPLCETRLAFVGDGNNVCHSLLEAAALTGLQIRVATPEAFAPDPKIVQDALRTAETTGSTILLTNDPFEAVTGVDAVYTDAWISMGDEESERRARLKAFANYQVNAKLMSRARDDAIFMHCLPDHRGQEVTADVVDGSRSVVFDQAENRLHSSLAILEVLLTRQLRGSQPASENQEGT